MRAFGFNKKKETPGLKLWREKVPRPKELMKKLRPNHAIHI